MLADRGDIDPEHLRHTLSDQPDSFLFNGGIDAKVLRRGAVSDKVKFIWNGNHSSFASRLIIFFRAAPNLT